MITTIQLNENVKKELERMKESTKETYEEVILSLIRFAEQQKRKQKELLVEQCKEMYEEDIRIAKEWDSTLLDGDLGEF